MTNAGPAQQTRSSCCLHDMGSYRMHLDLLVQTALVLTIQGIKA